MTLPAWYWTLDYWEDDDDLPVEVRAVICDAVNGYLRGYREQGESDDELTMMSQLMWLQFRLTGCPGWESDIIRTRLSAGPYYITFTSIRSA